MKFVYGILVLLALLAAALFLVPPFLDWERFKPEIAERLEAITGRALAIDGPIEVSILPAPTITAVDLRIANAPGAAAPDMVRIESLELRLALGPLLGGEIAVTSLAMVEPVIELQRLADGRPNWLFERAPRPATDGSAAEEAEASSLELARIDSVTVSNGTIVYRHADDRPPERIERIDAALSSRSLDGPFRGEGEFAVRGRAIAFQLATGTIGDDHAMPTSFEATVGDERGSALLEGTVRAIDGFPAFDGTVRAEAPDLGALLNALDVDLGTLPGAPLANEFSAKGALSASADAVAGRELQLRLGESQANGALSWQGGEEPLFDAQIALNRIDLDQYLPAGDGPEAEPAAGTGGAAQSGDGAAVALLQTIPDDMRRLLPGDIAAAVDFSIDALTWREGVIRQAKAVLALEDGVVAIRRASALLPGGAVVQLSGRLTRGGERPWLEGTTEIATDDLRAVLSWLDVDVGAVPADRLRRFDASVDVSARGDLLSASDLDIRIDTTRVAGNAAIAAGERPLLTAALSVDSVNIDAYLLADANGPAAATGGVDEARQEPAPATAGSAGDGTWEALSGIDTDVTLTIDALIYDGVRLAGLALDAALEDGELSVRRAAVADAVGVSVSMTGDVHTVWTAPTYDLALEGAADSLAGVTARLDIDPDIRSEAFGRITLEGSLAGDWDALTLDLALAAGPAEMSLAGTVERPFDTPAAALALGLRAPDAAALARTAGLTPPAAIERLGALVIDGGIGGDLDSVAIDLSAQTAGATLKVSGRVAELLAAPSYSLVVDLVHPRAEALVETIAGLEAPAGAATGALRIAGTVSGNRAAADIAGIDAAVGDNRVTGEVFLRLDQEPPAIAADLHAGALDLAWVGAGLAATGETEDGGALTAEAGVEGAAPESERWSDEEIDLAVIDRLSGTLALDAEALILGTYRIERAEIELAAAEGTLTLRSLRGRLFDGALEADGSLAAGPVPAGQGAFRLTDADLSAILLKAAGVEAVSGRATVGGYFTLRGQTEREMVQSLAGRLTLTAGEGAIDDVDLAAISRQIGALARADALDDIAGFVASTERSLSSGRTAIRSLDGTVRVQDGQARIDGFRIVADGGVGDIGGTADLPAWQMDLTALFRLDEHPDAPPVGVRLKGPLDRPERHYLIEEMQTHLVGLGLLSLARSQDAPTITIRKGAKAEPGTGMDALLRGMFGDPDEAQDAGHAEETEETERPKEVEEAVDTPEADGEGKPALPPIGELFRITGGTEEAAQVEEPEGVSGADEAEQAEGAKAADEEEADAQPPADEAVPAPPRPPQRDRDADLRDFVDDVLKAFDE